MKIVFFTRKKLLIIIFAILVIISVIYLCNASYSANTIVVELAWNTKVSNEWLEKIEKLTEGEDKIAYLTFDDGPTTSVTPKILDILKEQDIKATFFVIGKYVDRHPEIVKRAYEEGHYIANHGYDHNNSKMYQSSESFSEEIEKTDLAIANAIGVENYCSHVFRFPNGFMSPQNKDKKKNAVSLLEKMDYTYIDWNCLNNDSIKKYTNQQLLNNLKKSSKNKNTLVVLMHDTKDVNDSSLVLKESISYLKSQGYEFRNFYSVLDRSQNFIK